MTDTLQAAPLTNAEAESLLSWWLEAGVDVAVSDEPRNWLKASKDAPAATKLTSATPQTTEPARSEALTLDAFHQWLADAETLPLFRPGAKRVLPDGREQAPLMLLSDLPGPEEAGAGRPIAGPAWILTERMLQAIQIDPASAYVASLSCFLSPGSRITREDLARCGELAREQVRLAKPERLILFGDAPARALTGLPLGEARGRIHHVEGVRTIATFHPRWLLQRPSDKALAWRDLLLLMSEDN